MKNHIFTKHVFRFLCLFLKKPFIFLVLLASCENNILPSGSGKISHSDLSILQIKNIKELPKNARSAVHVSTLAIGQSMIEKLDSDLKGAGLTADQANVIVAKANQKLESAVGALVLPESELALTDENSDPNAFEPIFIASPAIIEGTMEALSSDEAKLPTPDDRSKFAEISLSSSFGSLNGNISNLDESGVNSLAQKMVGTAVKNLNKAGLGEESAGSGIKAITSGAVSALDKAGISENSIISVAKAVVTGAVTSLKEAAVSEQHMAEVIGQVAEGAVGAMNQISKVKEDNSQGVSIAGELASATMESMSTLSLAPQVLIASVKDVSKGAVSGLGSAKLAEDKIADAVQSITGSMVKSLGKASVNKDIVKESAGAVAAGAVSGIKGTGLDEAKIASSGVISKAMQGTMSSLGETGLSTVEIASSMSVIVGGAIASIGDVGVGSDSIKDEVISHVISGTMTSFASAGIKDAKVVEVAVKNMSKGATEALPSAGVKSEDISKKAALVAKTSISKISAIGVKDSESLNAVASTITQGVMVGVGTLSKTNQSLIQESAKLVSSAAIEQVSQINKEQSTTQNNSSNVVSFSTNLASSIFQGLASSGVEATAITSLKEEIKQSIVSDLQNQSITITESQISQINSQIETSSAQAETLATQLSNQSFDNCQTKYSDTLSDDQFASLVSNLSSGILCMRLASEVCPKKRIFSGNSHEWLPFIGQDLVCEYLKIKIEEPVPTSSSTSSTSQPLPAPPQEEIIIIPEVILKAQATGVPSGTTKNILYDIKVSGENIAFYKYKFGLKSTTVCSQSSGYSSSKPISELLTLSLSDVGDGQIILCILGGNSLDQWQKLESATSYEWVKDTTPPKAFSILTSGLLGKNSTLKWSISQDAVSYTAALHLDLTCADKALYTFSNIKTLEQSLTSVASGSYAVCITAFDSIGNSLLVKSSSKITIDLDSPSVSLNNIPSIIDNLTTTGDTTILSGSAFDLNGLSKVEISFSNSKGLCLDQLGILGRFNSTCPNYLTVNGTDNFSITLADATLHNDLDGLFTLSAIATDKVGNVSAVVKKSATWDKTKISWQLHSNFAVPSTSSYDNINYAFSEPLSDNIFVYGNLDGAQVSAKLNLNDPTKNQINKVYGYFQKILIDNSGQIYQFSEPYKYSSESSGSSGADWLIEKFASDGKLIWSKTFTSTGLYSDDRLYDAAFDKDGNLIVVGSGSNLVSELSGEDWLIRKIDSLTGEELALASFDHSNSSYSYNDHASDVFVDESGTIWVGGSIYGNDGSLDWQIKKLDSNLNALGVNISYGTYGNYDELWDIVADGTRGFLYVAGSYYAYVNGVYKNVTRIAQFDAQTGLILAFKDLIPVNDWSYSYYYNSMTRLLIDLQGNIYAGLDLENLASSSSGRDIWIMKLTASMEVVWERYLNSSAINNTYAYSYDYLQSFEWDSFGNILIGASGDNLYSSTSTQDWWLQKIDQNGMDVTTFGTNGTYFYSSNPLTDDETVASVVDSNGNIYSAGWYYNGNSADWWIKKISSQGTILASVLVSSSNNQAGGYEGSWKQPVSIEIDEARAAIYVIGYGYNLVSTYSSDDWWIKKYDFNLNEDLSWDIKLDPDAGYGRPTASAIDQSGNLYVGGGGYNIYSFESGYDWLILKIDANGNQINSERWPVIISSTSSTYTYTYDQIAKMVIDKANSKLYVLGTGDALLSQESGADWWIKKFDLDGNEDINGWPQVVGTTSYDEPKAIAIDSQGSVYAGGQKSGSVNSYFYDWWIVKFTSNGQKVTGNWDNMLLDGGKGYNDFLSEIYINGKDEVFIVGGINSQNYGDEKPAIRKFSSSGIEDLNWQALEYNWFGQFKDIVLYGDQSVILSGYSFDRILGHKKDFVVLSIKP